MPAASAHGEELIELGKPVLTQGVRLPEKRAVAQKHTDAIDAQLLHSDEVLPGGFGVKTFSRVGGAQPVLGR